MLTEPTVEKLTALKLHGMLAASEGQQRHAETAALGFDERFALLVDAEHLDTAGTAGGVRANLAG